MQVYPWQQFCQSYVQSAYSARQGGGPPITGEFVGISDMVGLDVVGAPVGLGEMVGEDVPLDWTDISAQLKNCSGQVVPRVPSLGYGGVQSVTPTVQ